MFEVWHLWGQMKRKPDTKERCRGHKVSQHHHWTDIEGISPYIWCHLSILLHGVHSLAMVTGEELPWNNPQDILVLEYSSLCLLAFLFRLNFFLNISAISGDRDCYGPVGCFSLGNEGHLLIPGTAGLSTSTGLPCGMCFPRSCLTPSRSSCNPQAVHQAETRHPALHDNVGCCLNFSLPVIAQQLGNALLTDVYN